MPSRSPRPHEGLHHLTAPASVAIVGASNNPQKWGYWLASGALEGSDTRAVYLVNRSAQTILGRACAPNLGSLPVAPELVALCTPAAQARAVVKDGLAMGVRAFVGITAGISDEAALAAQIRAGGARLLGANSLGLYDAESNLRLAWGSFTPGSLAIVSQSGQLGSELVILCARHGIGISRFVSVGNQSDISAIELLDDLIDHRATRAVALYLEDFSDGEVLFATLRRLRAAGKPTLLLTVGESSAATRVARSHTGSLTSATELVDAVCRAAGVLRVRTPRELVSVVSGLLAVRTSTGDRVAIVGDSGGQCAIAADVATSSGLRLPELEPCTMSTLESVLPAGAASQNPVDLAGAGESDLTAYAAVVDIVLSDPGVDALILTGYFGRYGSDSPGLTTRELQVADQITASSATHRKTVLIHSMEPAADVEDALWRQGIPTTNDIREAVDMIRHLAALSAAPPDSPAPHLVTRVALRPGFWAARELLSEAGATFPSAHPVRSAQDVRGAAAALTAPFVLKAGWIEHKSEAGAVRVGLSDADALLAAFGSMRMRLGDGEYVVEEQDTRSGCLEMLVGARRDRALGPFVVVGRGGIEAEVWHDVVVEQAPVSVDTAAAMIASLRCAPLFTGWRGRPPLDSVALARLVVAVSHLVADRTDIAEVELNPVRVAHDGALAVDALVVPLTSHYSPTPLSTKDAYP